MQIKELAIYRGRNIYCHRPVMKMILDIGKYGNIPTKNIDGFNTQLLNAFPGLKTNYCGLGYEGGFLEKLKQGTYLAHVVEHVILEMQYLLGYDVRYGKTRVITEPSLFYLIYEYQNETCGSECGKTAVYILNHFINNEQVDINSYLDFIKRISTDSELGPSTAAITAEAKMRNIPVTRIGSESLVQLGYGKYSRLIQSTLTDVTSCISADIASNKQLTKLILKSNRIPVPYGKVVYSEISALMAADEIGRPVVIKPYDGNQGKGVHLNLASKHEICAAFREASKYSGTIIVEQYIPGKDFRILVVGGKIAAVSERLPAFVTGDGKHSIKELVEITNLDKNRGEDHEKPLTKIKLDGVALNVLNKKGLDISYIPSQGEKIILRENRNISTGGSSIDCTNLIHPDNADLAVRAAKAIGLDIAGIDMVAEDIKKSICDTGGAIVEVNSSPGIRMHLYPGEGIARNVAKDIVDMLFSDDSYLNFPIVSITGANKKAAVSRIISHILEFAGRSTGMICSDGIFIKTECIFKGCDPEYTNAKTILSNKVVDAAVIEMSVDNIIYEGLSYDLADVGIVIDIKKDNLNHDGVKTLEDLAFVESLVTEAVKPNGYAVLNAECEMIDYLLERVKTKVILFSKDKNTSLKYKSPKYIYVFEEHGYICVEEGNRNLKVIKAGVIPNSTKIDFDCYLAAVSALYGLDIPLDTIAKGLNSFTNNQQLIVNSV